MISVNDIISGSDSLLTTQHIYGRLHIVNDASKSFLKEYQRGTILLLDIYNPNIKIICQVDRLYHDLQDTAIEIPSWTLVTLKDHFYLEFSIEPVKRLSNPFLTVKEEQNNTKKHLLNLLKTQHSLSSPSSPQQQLYFCLVPHQLTQLSTSINQLGINLLGYISAKSVLYDKPGSEVVFFIELMDTIKTSSNDRWSIPIVFKGDHLMKYYAELQVGRFYIFNNLTPTTITSSISSHSYKRHFKRHILKYNVYQSLFIELSKKQHQSFYLSYCLAINDIQKKLTPVIKSSSSSSSSTHLKTDPSYSKIILQLTLHDSNYNNSLTHYKGTVTRIIDPLFGIYELDNEIILCLFHYLGYSEKQPYHLGTYLVIHQVHMVALESTTTENPSSSPSSSSLLLDKIWKAPFVKRDHHEPIRIALIACMRSNIKIEMNHIKKKDNNNSNTSTIIHMEQNNHMLFHSESNNINNMKSNSFYHLMYKRLIYWHCIHYCHDFTSLLKQLELYASLQFKFPFLFEQQYYNNHDQNENNQQQHHPLIYIGKCIIQSFFSHSSHQHHAYHHGDIYGDFFQHRQTCLAINTVSSMSDTTSIIKLPIFPTLQEIITSILNDSINNEICYKFKNIKPSNMNSLYLASSCVDVIRYNYDTTTSNDISWVIGIIDVLPDGRLYFKDDTYRILLVINSEKKNDDDDDTADAHDKISYEEMVIKLQLGDLYFINRFHLVVEDLSYSRSIYTASNKMEENKIQLEYIYMMCNWKDIQYVAPIHSVTSTIKNKKNYQQKKKKVLSIPFLDEDTKFSLCHFMVMDESLINDDIALYYIVDIMPTSTRYNQPQGTLHLEQWVRAIRYKVTSVNNRHLDWDPTMVTLVFSSQFNSLSYTYALKIGTWFGFSHVHQSDPFIISPQAYPKIRNSRVHQHPTYYIDHDQYQFYYVLQQNKNDLLSSSSTSSSITALSPVFRSTSSMPSTINSDSWKECLPIITVSQFITIHEASDQRQRLTKKNQFINVRGVVLFKSFINEDGDYDDNVSLCQLKKDAQLFQKLNIGFGKRGRQLFIRLRQLDGLQTLDIYMEHEDYQILHTAGIITGNIITLYKVEKRQSIKNKNIYGRMGPHSYIQVEPQLNTTFLENAMSNLTDNIPMTSLISLHSSSSTMDTETEKGTIAMDDVIKINVTVRMFLKLQLQWLCKNCGTVITGEKCYNGCQHGGFLFLAEAIVVVSDGTSDAHAFINGEQLVFQLLMLLPNQETAVKLASLKHGTLSFGKYMNDKKDTMEQLFYSHHHHYGRMVTLEDLCRRVRIQGHYIMYGKRFYSSNSTNSTTTKNQSSSSSIMKELGLRTVNIIDQDQTIQTLAFDHIKMKILALESIDSSQFAWSLINNLLT